MWPTIEDIYQASIETDKGVRELVRFYDTAGLDLTQLPEVGLYSNPDPSLMVSFGQIAKQYASFSDAFVLMYDTSRPETFDCLVTLKKEIDKNKEKKDVSTFIQLSINVFKSAINLIYLFCRHFMSFWATK